MIRSFILKQTSTKKKSFDGSVATRNSAWALFTVSCPSARYVWSTGHVLEGFVLSLSWKSSPCGSVWTEWEWVQDSQLVSYKILNRLFNCMKPSAHRKEGICPLAILSDTPIQWLLKDSNQPHTVATQCIFRGDNFEHYMAVGSHRGEATWCCSIWETTTTKCLVGVRGQEGICPRGGDGLHKLSS